MTEYPEIIEEFAEQIIEVTEHRDDLDANIATFCESLEQQIRDKVSEIAVKRFCPTCSAKMRTSISDVPPAPIPPEKINVPLFTVVLPA